MEIPNDIKSYLNIKRGTTIPTSSFSCFDDFYCNSAEMAKLNHIILGVIGLILTISGIVLNILLLPVFTLVGIRSSATCYMIAMTIPDLCHLVINLFLSVIRYLPTTSEDEQLIIYQNFVAYFVPLGFPLKCVCQTLSLAFCICLLLDRYIYITKDSDANREVKRKISVKVIISVAVLVILIKLPNFLLLKIVENEDRGSIIIKWTSLANSWIFVLDILLFSIFYLILFISVIMIFFRSLKSEKLLKINVKQRFNCEIEERYRRRERLYVTVAFAIGIITIVFKLPHIILLFIYGSNPSYYDSIFKLTLLKWNLTMEVSDMILIMIKPILYLGLAVHFRRSLKDMIGLWIRPKKYTEINVAGGIGKKIQLSNNGTMIRSDTSKTLLKNYVDVNECEKYGTDDLEALAKNHLKKSDISFVDSSGSFTSTSG